MIPDQRPNARTIAIGDIHGCSIALQKLLDVIAPQPEDTVVILGDFVDWGPDSRGVIEQLIRLKRRCTVIPLRGNHEEMLLDAFELDPAMQCWLALGGDQTLNSYRDREAEHPIPSDHLRFIRSCQEFHETPTHIFVHANYEPDLPLEQTGGEVLRWRSIDDESMRPHQSGKTVVVGHTPQVNGHVLDLGFLLCIDTDCSRGGWLTALDVHNRVVMQANQKGQMRTSTLSSN